MTPHGVASKVPVRAYVKPDFNPAVNRWHWQIIANDNHHSVIVAQSVSTFPTEHDANAAGKALMGQLLAGELASSRYDRAKHEADKQMEPKG